MSVACAAVDGHEWVAALCTAHGEAIPSISMLKSVGDAFDNAAALKIIASSAVQPRAGLLEVQIVPADDNELLLVGVDVYRSADVLAEADPVPRSTSECDESCLASRLVERRLNLEVEGISPGEVVIVSSLVVTDSGVVSQAWGMTVSS